MHIDFRISTLKVAACYCFAEEPTLAIRLLKATAAISEAQGREGSSCMQSGQNTAASTAAELHREKHASQMESLKAMELEASILA